MNKSNRYLIEEATRLMAKAQRLLGQVTASLEKPVPGKPDAPRPTRIVESRLYRLWDHLKGKGTFTAFDAWLKAAKDNKGMNPSQSAFSATLSNWARRGFIEIVERGVGPTPTVYRIRSE